MTHNCDLLVISCIDFRFQEPLRRFLEREGYRDNYDLVSLAGGAGNLVSPAPHRQQAVWDQVEISVNLHRIKKIYLINHQNCGAYGNAFASGSAQEGEKHRHDLLQAKEETARRFPNLAVFTFFIKFANNDYARAEFAAVT